MYNNTRLRNDKDKIHFRSEQVVYLKEGWYTQRNGSILEYHLSCYSIKILEFNIKYNIDIYHPNI